MKWKNENKWRNSDENRDDYVNKLKNFIINPKWCKIIIFPTENIIGRKTSEMQGITEM